MTERVYFWARISALDLGSLTSTTKKDLGSIFVTFMLGEATHLSFHVNICFYTILCKFMSSAIFLLACISSMYRIIGAFHIVCLIAFLVDVNSV